MASKPKGEESAAAAVPAMPASAPVLPAAAATAPERPLVSAAAMAAAAAAPASPGRAIPGETSISKGVEKAMKTAEEFVAFSQGNLEALIKSGQIWANGLQDLGKQVAASAQAQFEETMSAVKALAGAKSVKDAFDLQAGFARAAIEKTLAESGKIAETSVKLTEQTLAPLTARVALAVETFGRPAA